MNLAVAAITAAERLPLPDPALRYGIGRLVGRTRRLLAEGKGPTDRDFARSMSRFPIAVHTDAANAQHYELPAAFFSLVLGPRRKYSSCLYASPVTTLAEAEIAALEETCAHADLADGQDILELGCGWGSLSLFMAERFPSARIVSVSNSASQRAYIEAEARLRGLANLTVITADMNTFSPVGAILFDHPDPSIFTVLTAPTEEAGTANVDFVIFPPRWMVAEHTFRPPWYHRNIMSEFMGLIHGQYDAKEQGFVPGGMSLHNMMLPHGPDATGFEKASNSELKPVKLDHTMAFMFETRYPQQLTRYAAELETLQDDYLDCWEGLERRFDGTPGIK